MTAPPVGWELNTSTLYTSTVTVAEDFKLTVNGQPGKRTANKQFLEN